MALGKWGKHALAWGALFVLGVILAWLLVTALEGVAAPVQPRIVIGGHGRPIPVFNPKTRPLGKYTIRRHGNHWNVDAVFVRKPGRFNYRGWHWKLRWATPRYTSHWRSLGTFRHVTTYWDGTRSPGSAAISMARPDRAWLWKKTLKLGHPFHRTVRVNDKGSHPFDVDVYSRLDHHGPCRVWVQVARTRLWRVNYEVRR